MWGSTHTAPQAAATRPSSSWRHAFPWRHSRSWLNSQNVEVYLLLNIQKRNFQHRHNTYLQRDDWPQASRGPSLHWAAVCLENVQVNCERSCATDVLRQLLFENGASSGTVKTREYDTQWVRAARRAAFRGESSSRCFHVALRSASGCSFCRINDILFCFMCSLSPLSRAVLSQRSCWVKHARC